MFSVGTDSIAMSLMNLDGIHRIKYHRNMQCAVIVSRKAIIIHRQ